MEQTLAEYIDEMERSPKYTSYAVLHMFTWHDLFYLECCVEEMDDGDAYYVYVVDQRCGETVERINTTKYDLEAELWKAFHKYNDIEAEILVSEMDEA